MFIKSNNIYQLLNHRELGKRESLQSYKDQMIIKNIRENNCSITTFRHKNPIIGIDVQDYLAVTVSLDHTVKLWNIETGECVWKFDPNPRIQWSSFVKIVNGSIVCSGYESNNYYNKTIRVIDLQTGIESASITNPSIMYNEICVIGNQIFVVLDDKRICEWNMQGKFIKVVGSTIYGRASRFLGFGNFLLYISNNRLMIHNIHKTITTTMELSGADKNSIKISSAQIVDGCHLVCGFSTYRKRNVPDCCLIDLEKAIIISQYRATGAFEDPEVDINSDEICDFDFGTVLKVKAQKDCIYMGHSTGKVVAVDLIRNTHTLLGAHKNSILYLDLEGPILISGSEHTTTQVAELIAWDTQTLTKIAHWQLDNLYNVFFVNGKILCAVDKILIQWDFLSNNEKENSKNKIVSEEVISI